MGYLNKAFQGFSWMAGLRGVTRGLALIRTAILARILLPAQFGIYGVATLVLGFLEMLTETGINIFLIQEKSKIDEYVDSAWVISILRGIIISAAIILLTPIITTFFNSPGASNILYLSSLIPLIRGFINPAVVRFQKDLEFNKQFYFESSLFLIDTTTAISLGFLTHSENSLIWGMIVAAIIEVVVSFLILKPKPRLTFNKEKALRILNRGKWITGAGVFNYLFQHLDDIFVGKILGTSSLGVYQQAYRISSIPVSEVGEVFNKVTFPIYSTIEGDKVRLKKAFFKTLLVITSLVVPFALLVFLFPRIIVEIVLGKTWLEAVPVLQVLAIFGAIKAISNSFFSLFLGIGKQEVVTLVTLIGTIVLALVLFPLINAFGILGAGLAAIVATIAAIPFLLFFFFKYFK